MFSTTNRCRPLAQALKGRSLGNKLSNEFPSSGEKVLNRSFDTAQQLLKKKPNLRQTKLCIRRSLKKPINPQNFTEPLQTKTELFLMPMPKSGSFRTRENVSSTQSGVQRPKQDQLKMAETKRGGLLERPVCSTVALVGKVDYALKTHQSRPDLNAIWDIYGRLVKIAGSKGNGENVLLLRDANGGPVLQCVYYDFDNTLLHYRSGCLLRVVGRFSGATRLRAFRLHQIDSSAFDANFIRIQNVASFVLLQTK